MAKEADAVKRSSHESAVNENSDPSAIEAAIARTRGKMSETLAAIEDRLSPEHLLGEVMDAAQKAAGEVTSAADNAARSIVNDAGAAVDDVTRSAEKEARAVERELEK
jgi:hypothetical protein